MALIDLGVILLGEVGVLIAGGVLIAAVGGGHAPRPGEHVGPALAVVEALLQAAALLGPGVYLFLTWSRGASVGMRALECRLRDAGGARSPTSSQVVLRLCGLWLSVVSAGIGLAWGWFRRDRRGWSDLIARTVVVHAPAVPVWAWPAWTPGGGWAAPPPPPPPLPSHPPPPPPPPAVPPTPYAARPHPAAPARTPWTWTDVLAVVVLVLPLSFGTTFVTVAVVKRLMGGASLASRRPVEAIASDITAYAMVFLLIVLLARVRRHAPMTALGLRRVEWRWLIAALPFAFAAFVLESITGQLSQHLFPSTPANQCVSIRSAYEGALPLAILGTAVIAPLVEEIAFRGLVFEWLRGRTPIAWAVVLSAALFSLEHIGFLQLTLFLPVFGAGLVLATLYHHARAIWPCVLVHATFNLVATLVLFNSVSC